MWSARRMYQLMFALIAAAPPALPTAVAAATSVSDDPGLTMIPPRCFDPERRLVPTGRLLVFHNRIVDFRLDGIDVRSELDRGTIKVSYAGDPYIALFHPLDLAGYGGSDARIYHATMDGVPIIVWEETVENIPRRAGLIGYRGRTLYPICYGVVRTPVHFVPAPSLEAPH